MDREKRGGSQKYTKKAYEKQRKSRCQRGEEAADTLTFFNDFVNNIDNKTKTTLPQNPFRPARLEHRFPEIIFHFLHRASG